MDTGSFCFDTLLSYRRHLRSDLTPHGGAHCPGPKWPGLRHGPPKLASPHRSAVPLVHVPEACQSPELLLSTLMSGHVHITSIRLGGLLSICYRFCHYPAKETCTSILKLSFVLLATRAVSAFYSLLFTQLPA